MFFFNGVGGTIAILCFLFPLPSGTVEIQVNKEQGPMFPALATALLSLLKTCLLFWSKIYLFFFPDCFLLMSCG